MLLTLLMMMLLGGALQDEPVATAPQQTQPDRAALQAGLAVLAEQIADKPEPVRSTIDFGAYAPPHPVSAAPAGDPAIPERAFTDRTWWEQSQCGTEPSEDCLRTARNRLALARVERMETFQDAPAASAPRARPQTCRMVTRPSETGIGGSFVRVCGDGVDAAEAERAMDEQMERLRPASQSCDQPAQAESHDLWISRCQAMPR